MSLFRVFDIAGSAMTAQSIRLNATASNLANAESATSSTGQPYRAKQVVFAATQLNAGQPQAVGVTVAAVSEDQAPPRLVYDPKNPLADGNGYIAMPNVNVVEEMTNMISASRSYQTNADMMNTAKTLLQRTLQLGQA
ncbi:flagellar basal body rod protein FlgC [Chitinimonas viridis]|uniref:Flagellar basal-body rod protein FlgC n=2 Tax=Chitinimonas TaxID=240411 RepID=A0ABT8B659_9NEIS|nr:MULTISPECIES: flagellar basal body rod protein FlgC [Chitinimonas]MBL8509246.1 flagellar basal body rod protein FlgC [Chitinimonas sp.]MDN3577489.1 flagellar basal body rod protein FlgC [Chitinimonas viridis]GLR13098.1 flagellar basal-body rod protein FlgC [Chitinimonas prasina]